MPPGLRVLFPGISCCRFSGNACCVLMWGQFAMYITADGKTGCRLAGILNSRKKHVCCSDHVRVGKSTLCRRPSLQEQKVSGLMGRLIREATTLIRVSYFFPFQSFCLNSSAQFEEQPDLALVFRGVGLTRMRMRE